MNDGARRRLTAAMNARYERLGRTWREIATVGGLSYETLRAFRDPDLREGMRRMRAKTKRGIEIGLQWPAGMVDRILSGEIDAARAADYGLGEEEHAAPSSRPALSALPGGVPVELRDDIERQLWAMSELSAEGRWELITLYRARQATEPPEQSRRAR